jgi:hypothetical protein
MFVTRATILIVLAALALAHYQFWQVRAEILAAERNHYFVPAKGQFVELRDKRSPS